MAGMMRATFRDGCYLIVGRVPWTTMTGGFLAGEGWRHRLLRRWRLGSFYRQSSNR